MPFFPFFSFFLFLFALGISCWFGGFRRGSTYSNSEAYELLMSGDVIVAMRKIQLLGWVVRESNQG